MRLQNANLTARFLGPGFNQFQNWNHQNEESGDSPDEEGKPETKKPRPQQDDDEGWTDWKNGEDIRNRFSSKKKPGRIIHLGDGSELFTDRNVGEGDDDDDDEHDAYQPKNVGEGSSSDEEESEEEGTDTMQVDGIKSGLGATSKPTSIDTSTAKAPETRHKSPSPVYGAPQSPSQR